MITEKKIINAPIFIIQITGLNVGVGKKVGLEPSSPGAAPPPFNFGQPLKIEFFDCSDEFVQDFFSGSGPANRSGHNSPKNLEFRIYFAPLVIRLKKLGE